MGEIADLIIDGQQCDLCGCHFKGPNADKPKANPKDPDPYWGHGHPATCWDCWKELTWDEKKSHARAIVPTYGY